MSETPFSAAAATTRGQYLTGIEPLRFISEAVEAPLPMNRAKAAGPPSASMISGTFMHEIYRISVNNVNRISVGGSCQVPGMGDDSKRLRQARIAAGHKSAAEAIRRFGWKPESTYRSHENGQTPVPPDAAKQYAKAYKTTAAWILTGDGPQGSRMTRLSGEIGAGSEVRPVPVGDSGLPDHDIPLPPSAPDGATALRVRGDSMYPRYMDGELVFYVKDGTSPSELLNRECVVQLSDGRVFLKRLRPGSKKNLFHLESWNAPIMLDQRVKWAAPVRWTERK